MADVLNQLHSPEMFEVGRDDVVKNNKVSRVTVRMTGDLGNGIQEIQDVTSASSPSEVVRRAIAVYHTLVKQKMAGNEPVVIVNEKDGTSKSIPLFS